MKYLLGISILINIVALVVTFGYLNLAYDMGWSHGLERGCWNAAYKATNKNVDQASKFSRSCFTENLLGDD